jgi:hypothetical protein
MCVSLHIDQSHCNELSTGNASRTQHTLLINIPRTMVTDSTSLGPNTLFYYNSQRMASP